ncbi:DUF192 domain-containing protein [Rhodoplanes sp. TEM]|uniref:DUF192 domain-containing protein n=1 Tax=Rhodoplanes tepidamans TaxID=200616 RepID=A0ABT5J6J5_RHOTP|nr:MULTISPECIES: DUF192 domain-containing protein [Rhodoplanes]MDC7785249.1 DUF192 domain-containing protein [Rhodoplanes tepidamans]MDC7984684.1 DUF192 domain-containing protein [Rhodoplanes sp. TEM]MDQ0353507.1 uncharacterized membrane protein (UPF0127 family) [Rhodoplanes tepidamans]
MTRRSVLLAALFAAVATSLLAVPFAAAPALAFERQTLEIATRSGVHVFSVELATTDAERAQGLMYRKELPEGTGMLFDFKRDEPVAMWMKNTYVSLDMLFITADGRIHRIAERTTPMSETIIQSQGPVRAVLEVVGGTARKLGIQPGDRIGHPIFSGR